MSDDTLKILDSEEKLFEMASSLLPAWSTVGFRDFGCTIHSVGCSYFNALGERLGYQAITELPIEPRGDYAFVGSEVRCDSAWFSKDKFKLTALIEFERYSGPTDMEDLVTKVKNLVLASHRSLSEPVFSILAYWTKNSQMLPDHGKLRAIFRSGFETSEKQRVTGIKNGSLRIYQLVHETVEHSDRWRLWKVKERTTE